MKRNSMIRPLPTLSKRLKGATFPCYSGNNVEFGRVKATTIVEHIPDEMQEQDSDAKSQLTQEWQRFFPGRSFGDAVKDFAAFIRAREQHDFNEYDFLLRSLDEVYFRTTEPVRFLDLIQEVWLQLQQIVAGAQSGSVLFEELYSHAQNDANRADAALRRVEQWIKVKRLTSSDQLIALLQSVPIVVWHESKPGVHAITTLSLPTYSWEDFTHTADILWPEVDHWIKTQEERIASATREQIVKALLPITKIGRADIDELDLHQQGKNDLLVIDRLRQSYQFLKWGDLKKYGRSLPMAEVSRFFWPAIASLMEVQRKWATDICKELSLKQPSSGQKTTASTESKLKNNEVPKKEGKSLLSIDPWEGVLQNYRIEELDKLLLVAGLLDSVIPLKVKADTTPRQWVAVAHALKLAKKTKADKATLHRAFVERYSEDEDTPVVKLSAFSRHYNDANQDSVLCLNRMAPILGISIDENTQVKRRKSNTKTHNRR